MRDRWPTGPGRGVEGGAMTDGAAPTAPPVRTATEEELSQVAETPGARGLRPGRRARLPRGDERAQPGALRAARLPGDRRDPAARRPEPLADVARPALTTRQVGRTRRWWALRAGYGRRRRGSAGPGRPGAQPGRMAISARSRTRKRASSRVPVR